MAEDMLRRDARICSCGHRCASHGSYAEGRFISVGGGQCGFCGCGLFDDTGRISWEPIGWVSDPMAVIDQEVLW